MGVCFGAQPYLTAGLWFHEQPDPERTAFALLRQHLTKAQQDQLNLNYHFDVVGGDSGTTYRILCGYIGNITVLRSTDRLQRFLKREIGRPIYTHMISGQAMCAVPEKEVPLGDQLLTQKMALELREFDTLKIANIG